MFEIGDDVLVDFDGEVCRGEVVETRNGWILARVLIDPATDFGGIGSRLAPVSNVIVRESAVQSLE